MSEKLDPNQEVIAAHIAATTAAFQVLVHCLKETGALEHGQVPEALRAYMEAAAKKREDNEIQLALLNDLRQALLD